MKFFIPYKLLFLLVAFPDMYDNLYTQIKEQINLNVVAKIQNFFIQEITGNYCFKLYYFIHSIPTFSHNFLHYNSFSMLSFSIFTYYELL